MKNGDVDALIRAFRLTHYLWGGRFNPVIVIDEEAAGVLDYRISHVYVHTNMNRNRSLVLKLWRPRIRLPRRKPRKRAQQLELNLWPKRRL